MVEGEQDDLVGLADVDPAAAANDRMSERVPSGLGRGVQAAHLDSLFAHDESEEWLDRR